MTLSRPLVVRAGCRIEPDPRRVAARVFLPGQEVAAPGTSRADGVVARCMELSDEEARQTLETVEQRFGARHRDLDRVLEDHFADIAHRVPDVSRLGPDRRRLLGAYFSHEVAVEAASLCNPSLVVAAQQGPSARSVRFVMSGRAVSEGHLSTVVFRSGTFTPDDGTDCVRLDPGSRFARGARHEEVATPRERLRPHAVGLGADPDTLDFVLSHLPASVGRADLDVVVDALQGQELTRTELAATIEILRRVTAGAYTARFETGTELSERTLFPAAADESHGMEDARFVRTLDATGPSYAATYTGYDGTQVVSRRLDTHDFSTFTSSLLTGKGALGKGLALFPRRIGGKHVALSRWDRENSALATSDDGYHWDEVHDLEQPGGPWDLVQVGNCGSPIETPAGWLVLTHGVGPMRSYSMSALLLDLDDPRRVVGRLGEPLLEPEPDERDGYVPNVVYSCGALLHDERVLVPYGVGDRAIRFAVVDLPGLLVRLGAHRPGTH